MAATRQDVCAICQHNFKDPKLIPCHHSFCCKCLEDYVSLNLRKGKFKCPICTRSVKLPKKGVAAFQVNFYIDSNESTRGTSAGNSNGLTCDVCGPEKEARCRCLECVQNLCQFCCKQHGKVTATKNHTLYDIGSKELEITGQIEKRSFCRKHPGEEIQLVCIKCRPYMTMCLKCKAFDHDTHQSKGITEAAAEIKRNLNVMLSNSGAFPQGEQSDKTLDDKERKEIEAIDRQLSKIQSALDLEATNMKDKVKSIYGKLRKENAVLTLAKNDALKLIEQGTCTEIVEKGQDLQNSLSKTISQINPLLVGTKNALFAPSVIHPEKFTALMGTVQLKKEFYNISPARSPRTYDEGYYTNLGRIFPDCPVSRGLIGVGVKPCNQEAEPVPITSNFLPLRSLEVSGNAFERTQQKTQSRHTIYADCTVSRGFGIKTCNQEEKTVPVTSNCQRSRYTEAIGNASDRTWRKTQTRRAISADFTDSRAIFGHSIKTCNQEREEKKTQSRLALSADPSDPEEHDEETKVKEVSDVSIPDRSGPEGSSGASSISTEPSFNLEMEADSQTTVEETCPKEI